MNTIKKFLYKKILEKIICLIIKNYVYNSIFYSLKN